MLEKSLSSTSDVIIYDLEDSVAPSQQDKTKARNRLTEFLRQGNLPDPQRIAVRVNGINTPFFDEDIVQIVASSAVESLVLPKIHSGRDLHFASRAIFLSSRSVHRSLPLNIIPSIESARGMWNVGRIAAWKSEYDILGGRLSALLFAAEDYCADTSVIRSPSRRELLYPRSQIVIAAKAFKLDAIDMVCVNYKDNDYLKEECIDGRRLGFTGKQAIHPSQVGLIQSSFVPTSEEILRAAKIVRAMQQAQAIEKGAVGLEGEMIDAPMLKQAEKTIQIAMAAGLEIPNVS